MNTVTIPRQLASKGDLVVIPRKEYNELLKFKKLEEFHPTVAQKKALMKAESNLAKGKTLSYHDLAKQLGFTG